MLKKLLIAALVSLLIGIKEPLCKKISALTKFPLATVETIYESIISLIKTDKEIKKCL